MLFPSATIDISNSSFVTREIPINPDVGRLGDMGTPIVEKDPDNEISKIYIELAKKIKESYL